jgi:putative ABC transport system permease protein
VAQSIVIRIDPARDRDAAIESLRRDFAGSLREATPQVDTRDLGRLRAVPWLIAALVGVLALATLVHALVTLHARHRLDLAVLAALGFTRRQRRGVTLLASVAAALLGALIGVPLGVLVGIEVWRGAARGTGLQPPSAVAWPTILVALLSATAAVAAVTTGAARRSLATAPAEQLRVE